MNAQQAMDKMVAEGIDPDLAGWLVNLAFAFGHVSIPAIWKGPDSWGSEIDFYIQHVPEDPERFTREDYIVKFTERKLY